MSISQRESIDVTITDHTGPVKGKRHTAKALQQLHQQNSRNLQEADRHRHNVIIQPRSTTALLIQLDDISDGRAAQMQPHAFLTLRTSPGNGQVWLAVSDGPQESDEAAAKQFRIRVRKGAKAPNLRRNSATRIAGSLNFKPDYAPDFPVVTLTQWPRQHDEHCRTRSAD